jgi:hypothetical protein
MRCPNCHFDLRHVNMRGDWQSDPMRVLVLTLDCPQCGWQGVSEPIPEAIFGKEPARDA